MVGTGPANRAFEFFTTGVEDGKKLVLASGTRGAGSSIEVRPVEGDTLAIDLKLVPYEGANTLLAKGADGSLKSGSEKELDLDRDYSQFIGARAKREGLFALEEIDLFNLLVLAGVNETGVLIDAAAYCQERRAFLIIDSPYAIKPEEMEKVVSGTALPKTNYAAVYYPWLQIADPLATGQLREVPPSGTIAGLFARTDRERGVWKAPAGIEARSSACSVQRTCSPMARTASESAGHQLPARRSRSAGRVVWGARTLDGRRSAGRANGNTSPSGGSRCSSRRACTAARNGSSSSRTTSRSGRRSA